MSYFWFSTENPIENQLMNFQFFFYPILSAQIRLFLFELDFLWKSEKDEKVYCLIEILFIFLENKEEEDKK